MDPALTASIAAATTKALQSAELKARYAGLGVEASALGPSEFARTIAQESDKWKKVIAEHRIVAE
jgi:tripartite-type tricarboxylate transporter receptor subunit TctC